MTILLNLLYLWLRKKFFIFIGISILIIGLIVLPTPIPLGVPLIAIAMVILLSHSHIAKRGYIRIKRLLCQRYTVASPFFHKLEQVLRLKKRARQPTSSR